MEARMTQPAVLLPDAMQALQSLHKATVATGLTTTMQELVHLRASQINGCSVCVDMHSKALKSAGEADERIFGVGAWREMPYYTESERAALALTEALTRLADQADPVPDELWAEVTKHFDEEQLAGLLIDIAAINVWNRLNAATRQVAGAWAG